MTRAARLEGIAQVGILLIMGAMAGAASFTHIHDLTVAHGQPSWIGWTNAIVVDLMSIVAGLESRRRKRAGQPVGGFVLTVLVAATIVSLAAQVAQAEPTPWGWLVAALPALGFLAVVKIVLTRTPAAPRSDRSSAADAGPVELADRSSDLDESTMAPTDQSPLTGPDRSEDDGRQLRADTSDADRTEDEPVVPLQRINGQEVETPGLGRTTRAETGRHLDSCSPHTNGSGRDRDRSNGIATGPDRTGTDDELWGLWREIAEDVTTQNGKLTRDVLIKAIRTKGKTISTDRASEMLRKIKAAEAVPIGGGG